MKKSTLPLLLIFLISLFCSNHSYGQNFTFPIEGYSKKIQALDLKYSNSTWGMNGHVYESGLISQNNWSDMTANSNWSAKYSFPVLYDYINVKIDHSVKYANSAYHYRFSFIINGYLPANPNTVATVEYATLDLEYDPARSASYKDEAVYKFQNSCSAYKVFIEKIESVPPVTQGNPIPVPVPVSQTALANNFIIEPGIKYQKYDLQVSSDLRTRHDLENSQLNVSWGMMPYTGSSSVPHCHLLDPLVSTYPYAPIMFELEWLYLDDYDYDLASGNSSHPVTDNLGTISYSFRNNATRIRTYERSYKIPLTYERGLILYRVRALRPDAGFQNLAPVGDWTLPESGVFNLGDACSMGADGYIIPQAVKNDLLNWQYTVSFAEDAKYKHVINYFDGLNKNRQNVTWLNSLHQNNVDDYVVAQQNVYDLEGRPSIKTLPIPVKSTSLNYIPGLLTTSNGVNLTASQFDLPGARCQPVAIPPLDATATGNGYYSTSNPDKTGINNYIPDAKGFPYVQTLYAPDNTNKVAWQGGAGDVYQPWNGHATKYDYVRADQLQLNRLFGTEGGKAEYYPKQMVTDPNGQTSLSIFDPEGKVVATGLAGYEPGHGQAPSNYPIDAVAGQPAPVTTTKNYMNGEVPTLNGNRIGYSTSFYNDVPTSLGVALNHHATIPSFSICDMVLRPQLKYYTRILNDCGVALYEDNNRTIGTWGTAGGLNTTDISSATVSGTLPSNGTNPPGLPAGKYTAESTIELDRDALRNQVSNYFDANSAPVSALKCYTDGPQFVYQEIKRANYPCAEVSGDIVTNDCDAKRYQMMKELYPGEKYGFYVVGNDGKFGLGGDNSIFTFPIQNAIPQTGPNVSVSITATETNGTTPKCNVTCGTHLQNCGAPLPKCGCADGEHDDLHPCCFSCLKNKCKCIRFTKYTGTKTTTYAQQTCNVGSIPHGGFFTMPILQTIFPTLSTTLLGSLAKEMEPEMTCQSGVNNGVSCNLSHQVANGGYACNAPSGTGHSIGIYDLSLSGCPSCYYNGRRYAMIYQLPHTWIPTPTVESFSISRVSDDPIRYMSSCITLPQPVTINGTQYTSLKDIDPDILIASFNDDIAKALLPLHPEYCRLALCDKYSEEIESIKTYSQAVAAGRADLAQLVSNDPLHTKSIVTDNELQYIPGTNNQLSLKTAALTQAYCGTEVNPAYQHCTGVLYANSIANGVLPDGIQNDQYWSILKSLYTGNRNYIIYKRISALDNTCGPCPGVRMEQRGTPVFDGNALSSGTIGSGIDGSDVPQEVMDFLNNPAVTNANTTSLSNSAAQKSGEAKQEKMGAIVDGIITQLGNCGWGIGLGAELTKGQFATALLTALDYTNPNSDIELTPEMVKAALTSVHINRSDLCHPFLVDYASANNYSAKASATKNYICKSDDFYAGFTSFLNDPTVSGVINNAYTSANYPIIAMNTFLADVTHQLTFGPLNPLITPTLQLNSYNDGGPSPVRRLQIRLMDQYGNPGNFEVDFYFSSTSFPSGFGVKCVNSPTAGSRISENIVRLGGASAVAGDVYCWSLGMPFLETAPAMHSGNTLTCIDARNGLTSFINDAPTYSYDAANNHPLFGASVTNYLNYKYQRGFTYNDYERLLNGCAVSDAVVARSHRGTIEVTCNNQSSAIAFAESLKNNNYITQQIDYRTYRESGNWKFLIDLTNVPLADQFTVKATIQGLTPSGAGYIYRPVNPGAPAGSIQIIDNAGNTPSISWPAGYTSQPTSMDPVTNTDNYTLYTFSLNSSAAADIATAIATLKNTFPAGIILADYRLWRSSDYNTADKQSYLNLVNNYAAVTDRDQIVKAILPASLTGAGAAFNGRMLSYEELFSATPHTNLYLQGASAANSSVDFIIGRVNLATANKPFNLGGSSKTISAGSFPGNPAQEIMAYKNGDGSYWFRYFGVQRQMINIFVTPPENAGNPADWVYSQWSLGPAFQGDKRSIVLKFTNGVSCYGYVTGITEPTSKAADVVLYTPIATNAIAGTNCEYEQLQNNIQDGLAAFDNYRTTTINDATNGYVAVLAKGARFFMDVSTQDLSYQFTLYYYDQAGNLMKTVPPQGVGTIGSQLSNIDLYRSQGNLYMSSGIFVPSHQKVTLYRYNSRNQPIWQKTPDGGETYFFYDAQGRLRFSQNSRQRMLGRYSYTLYDNLSRIVESGEVKLDKTLPPKQSNPLNFPLNGNTYTFLNPYDGGGSTVTTFLSFPPDVMYADAQTNTRLTNVVQAALRWSIVRTLYDEPAMPDNNATKVIWEDAGQQNLRNRVSSLQYFESLAGGAAYPPWSFATHFSYDAAGNVKTFLQDCPMMASVKLQYVRVDYDYDLASGKINTLSYNRGSADQFYHKYKYDADNRLTTVSTSNDGIIWDRDASYEYYKHGPLAITKLGEAGVQSMEYAYTIQGWLKAINGETLHPETDMGTTVRGAANQDFAADVMAHSIDYHPGDYSPIGNTALQHLPSPAKGLYNGNIVRQTTGMVNPGAGGAAFQDMVRTYQYDQLNRLKTATNAYVNYTAGANGNPGTFSVSTTSNNPFGSNYVYDKDGNILNLNRRTGSGSYIDQLTYQYHDPSLNWLKRVDDASQITGFSDIQNQSAIPAVTAKNGVAYNYDGAGNLITDDAEGKTIVWDGRGKVTNIYDAVKKNSLSFRYDASGNRFYKEFVTGANSQDHASEYYVRDPAGQLLATYRRHSLYDARVIFIQLLCPTCPVRADPGTFSVLGEVVAAHGDVAVKVIAPSLDHITGSVFVHQKALQYPVSNLLAANPEAHDAFLLTSREYMDSLFAPTAVSGVNDDLAAALVNLQAGDVMTLQELLYQEDPAKRTLRLLCSPDVKGRGFIDIMAARKNVVMGEDCAVNAGLIWNEYGQTEADRNELSKNIWGYLQENAPECQALYLAAIAEHPPANDLLVNALIGAQDGNPEVLSALLQQEDPAKRTLKHLCPLSDDTRVLITILGNNRGVTTVEDCDANAGIIWKAYGQNDNGRSELSTQIVDFLRDHPAEGQQFYQAVLSDQPLMDTIRYEGSPFEIQMRELLRSSEAQVPNLYAYLDQWDGARAVLDRTVSTASQGTALYNMDPPTYIQDWLNVHGTDELIGALAESGISPLSLIDEIDGAAARGTGVGAGASTRLVEAAADILATNLVRDSLFLSEHEIYGSSRLGMKKYGGVEELKYNYYNQAQSSNVYGYLGGAKQHWWWPATGAVMGPLSNNVTQALTYNLANQNNTWLKVSRTTGQKHYELSDHLGNVLATVLDRRTGSENVHNETVNPLYPAIPVHDEISADVSSVSDYYPGGMPMKERTWVPSLTSKYKLGYQGQLKDDEIYGDGMSYAYKYRMEDVRLNRFWSVDPLTAKYAWNSSYAYSENRLVDGIELEGREVTISNITATHHRGTGAIQIISDVYINIKVINLSSNSEVNLPAVAGNLQSDLSSILSGTANNTVNGAFDVVSLPNNRGKLANTTKNISKDVSYNTRVTAQVTMITDPDQIKSTDWVFAIVDHVNARKDMEPAGVAFSVGAGKVAIGESQYFDYKAVNTKGRQLIFHEILHLLGAEDIYNDPIKKSWINNAMNTLGNNGARMNITNDQKFSIWSSTIGPWNAVWAKATSTSGYSMPNSQADKQHTRSQLADFILANGTISGNKKP